MLKLEKSKSRRLVLREREKSSIFDSQLATAFVWALSLHALAYAIFYIKPFFIQTTFVFPPVQVASGPKNNVLALEVVPMQTEEFFLPWPQNSFLIEKPIAKSEFEADTLFLDAASALSGAETLHWFQEPAPLTSPPLEKRVQLIISGDLGSIPLLESDAALDEWQPVQARKDEVYANYLVYLDAKLGEIFWFDLINKEPHTERLSPFFEKMIHHLKFLPSQSDESIMGILHFTLLDENPA